MVKKSLYCDCTRLNTTSFSENSAMRIILRLKVVEFAVNLTKIAK